MPTLEVKRWLENIENEHKIQERISFLANIVETSNQSFCDLFNYSIEDLKGISLSLFMSNKWYEVKKLINKLSAGETVYLEKEHTRIDGTIVSLEIFIQSINGEDGSVLYYYVFMNDISERKKSERALIESETRYRTIFNGSPIALIEVDFSEVKINLEAPESQKPMNLEMLFENDGIVESFAQKIRIVDVNEASFKLYKAVNKYDFLQNFNNVFKMGSYANLKQHFIAISKNITNFEIEGTSFTLKGSEINIISGWSVIPGFENTFSRVLVYIIDITERKKLEKKLLHFATHDSMTGLYSRSFFDEELKILNKESDVHFGIFSIDIDGLKYINDIFGHQQGDLMLIELSKLIKKIIRPSDVTARIVGDEFAILIRNTDENKIQIISNRLRKIIDDFNNNLENNHNPISISVGYAIKNNNLKTVEQIFKEADELLFAEKMTKRERIQKSMLNFMKAKIIEKDYLTEKHMLRIKQVAEDFAEKLELTHKQKSDLLLVTELHDIG